MAINDSDGPRISSSVEPRALALTVALPAINPLALAVGRDDLSTYWERPSRGLAVAGFGAAALREAGDRDGALALLDRLQGDPIDRVDGAAPPGPWFGGLAFDLERAPGDGWRGFPTARWILPELIAWTRDGRSYLTAIGAAAGGVAALRRQIDAFAPSVESAAIDLATDGRAAIEATSDRAAWSDLVGAALAEMEKGAIAKVVLARAIDVAAPAPFAAARVLARLRAYAPECATFLVRGGAGALFVGATPETLCRVDGRSLATEALAGSIEPGSPRAWLDRDKERREHDAVTEAIVAGLRPLCSTVEVAPPAVLELRNIRHLRTPIAAQLGEGVTLGDLMRVLHPTPAVGGSPREAALAFLRARERLDRGWYAGAVGWAGGGAAELCVALRSARIDGRRARVFVGAGVIAGSTADGEWAETEAKSLPMLDALGGAP